MSSAVSPDKHFFSAEVAAAKVKVSLRHFRRLSEVSGVEPLHFPAGPTGSSEKFFWTQVHIDKIIAYRDGETSHPSTTVEVPTTRCPLYEIPIVQAECQRQSRKLATNEKTCCARGCPSPWRYCIHCLRQGYTGEESVVVDPIKGACEFHLGAGIRARRGDVIPVEKIEAPALADAVTSGEYVVVPARKVRPFKGQPRSYFDPEEMKSLEKSILKYGQLQPGLIRVLKGDERFDYELVDGQRRWHAAMSLGTPFKAVTIAVKDTIDQYEKSVVSNFQRSDHTPMENARAFDRLIKEGGRSIADISLLTGRSISWVSMHVKLLSLASELQVLMEPVTPERERIPLTLAVQLANLKVDEQREHWKEFKENGITSAAAVHKIKEKMASTGNVVFRIQKPAREWDRLMDLFVRTTRDAKYINGRLGIEDLGHVLENRTEDDFEEMASAIDAALKIIGQLRDRLIPAEKTFLEASSA